MKGGLKMSYCGECEHWARKTDTGLKVSDGQGVCGISGAEAGNMRHGCIMFTQRRKLEESTQSPIEKYKNEQNKKA